MILAHHAGEELVLTALVGGGGSALLVLGRARLAQLARWLRRR